MARFISAAAVFRREQIQVSSREETAPSRSRLGIGFGLEVVASVVGLEVVASVVGLEVVGIGFGFAVVASVADRFELVVEVAASVVGLEVASSIPVFMKMKRAAFQILLAK